MRGTTDRAYVIVTSPPGIRPPGTRPAGTRLAGTRADQDALRTAPGTTVPAGVRPAGRHRHGTPGTRTRYPGRSTRLPVPRRARHRRAERPGAAAVRYGTLAVLAGTVMVSGWFTAAGANALAQMAHP